MTSWSREWQLINGPGESLEMQLEPVKKDSLRLYTQLVHSETE